jgi:hypothetical protein
MMSENPAIDLLQTLTPEHQKQVIDFISFLKDREQITSTVTSHAAESWETDPFFGMWSDRTDLNDSVQWVRQLRQSQWSRS